MSMVFEEWHTMNENERDFFKVFEPQKYATQDASAFQIWLVHFNQTN